jgi:hypothetical protein
VMMYMSDRGHEAPPVRVSPFAVAGLAVSVAAVLYLGVYPTGIIDLALSSIDTIF